MTSAARAGAGGGELAIAPIAGRGVLIATPDGRVVRRLCPPSGRCPVVSSPQWSPDGRAIAYAVLGRRAPDAPHPVEGETTLLYRDGSCLTCSGPLFGVAPTFESTPGMVDLVPDGTLDEVSVDGRRRRALAGDDVTASRVSPAGTLAVAEGRAIWVGAPWHLRRIGPGREPDWSPDGGSLAFARGGRVVVMARGSHRLRAIARGTNPAWSPDGRRIAYVGVGGAIRIVTVATGRSVAAGGLRGRAVDWGPTPPRSAPGCLMLPGSRVVAASDRATVTEDGGGGSVIGLLGCIDGDGRTRVLANLPAQPLGGYLRYQISGATIAGSTLGAIFSSQEIHYGGESELVRIFDLRTGLPDGARGGEANGCDDYSGGCASTMDGLVVNALGDSAVHLTYVSDDNGGPFTEAIEISDAGGRRELDAMQTPGGPMAPRLANLALTDDTLSWTDDGRPQSAPLR